MVVKVAEKSLQRIWWDSEGSVRLLVSSRGLDPEQLLSVLEPAVAAIDAIDATGNDVQTFTVAPVPKGVSIIFDHCDSAEALSRSLALLATRLDEEGLEGRISPMPDEHPAVTSPGTAPPGLILGMSLNPAREDPVTRTEERARFSGGWAGIDQQAVSAVVQHALSWCRLEGGDYFFGTGMTSARIAEDQVEKYLSWALRAGEEARIVVSVNDATGRVVSLDSSGYAIYAFVGATLEQTVLDELPAVAVGLRHHLQYAAMQVRGSGAMRDPYWPRFKDALWSSYGRQLYLDPDAEDLYRAVTYPVQAHELDGVQVNDIYGWQLLGPDHPDVAESEHWRVESLDTGHRIVAARDVEAWLHGQPSLDVLVSAREQLVHLLRIITVE